MMKRTFALVVSGFVLLTVGGCVDQEELNSCDQKACEQGSCDPCNPVSVPCNTTVDATVKKIHIDRCRAAVESIYVDVYDHKTGYSIIQIDVATDEAFENIVSSDLYDFSLTVVRGLKPNTQYYVRARGVNGTNYSEYCETFPVKTGIKPVDSMAINAEQVYLHPGETFQFTATVLPTDATDTSVVWKSSNEKAATVDQTGKVTAVGAGHAAIMFTASNEYSVAAAVSVSDPVEVGHTEKLVLDKTTLNGNAVFGRFVRTYGESKVVEQNVSFDGTYRLGSFEFENRLIQFYSFETDGIYAGYNFGGLYRDVDVQGIPFSYTWTADTDYDFEGNDCVLVSDEHTEQTLGIVSAGAYSKLYLLSMADSYTWNKTISFWEMDKSDVLADVIIQYRDGTSDQMTVNFRNMLNKVDSIPYHDAYVLDSIVPSTVAYSGSEGSDPYMYAIPVDANPTKLIESIKIVSQNMAEDRKVALAVFAVTGETESTAPAAVNKDLVQVKNLSEYGFSMTWDAVENAEGYYFSVFDDPTCETVSTSMIFSSKVVYDQVKVSGSMIGASYENKYRNPGLSYYARIAAYNENGVGPSTVIPVSTVATYPSEIRLSEKEAELSIGESITLTTKFPGVYYTYSDIVWTVSDPKVLRVEDGKVTGIGAGTASVRAALADKPEIYRECEITVDSYGEGWIGYDNGVFMDDNGIFDIEHEFIVEIDDGAITIPASKASGELDSIMYYASEKGEIPYNIYLLDEGQDPVGQTAVASGTISATKVGWNTATLTETVSVPEGKVLWISVSDVIAYSDNKSENVSFIHVNGHWESFDFVDLEATMMLRAHFK